MCPLPGKISCIDGSIVIVEVNERLLLILKGANPQKRDDGVGVWKGVDVILSAVEVCCVRGKAVGAAIVGVKLRSFSLTGSFSTLGVGVFSE